MQSAQGYNLTFNTGSPSHAYAASQVPKIWAHFCINPKYYSGSYDSKTVVELLILTISKDVKLSRPQILVKVINLKKKLIISGPNYCQGLSRIKRLGILPEVICKTVKSLKWLLVHLSPLFYVWQG